MRKPIQISISRGQYYDRFAIICDDGSMWTKIDDKEWTRMPDVPQDIPQDVVKKYDCEICHSNYGDFGDKILYHKLDCPLRNK